MDTYDAGEEPVVGQELEAGGLDVRLEPVELDAVAVVDEHVFFLRDGVVRVVLQEPSSAPAVGVRRVCG